MKSLLAVLFFLSAALCSTNCSAQKKAGDLQRIVIIRHGEKPSKGDNLSCQGLNRALKLVDVLHKKIGVPDYVYAPAINTGKATSTVRMYQTIVPFAVAYNLAVDTKYDVKDAEGLYHSIKKKNGTVLLVWEHKAVHDILKVIGIENAPHWDDNDFDTMLIITFPNGKPVLTVDKENIIPAKNCP